MVGSLPEKAPPPWRAAPAHQRMGKRDRQRNQLGRLVGGIAEHEALVAGTAGVIPDARGDLGRLQRDLRGDLEPVEIETPGRVAVTGLADRLFRYLYSVNLCGCREFSEDKQAMRLDRRLDRNPGGRILREAGVEDAVRDKITQLIGMPGRHAFGGQEGGK